MWINTKIALPLVIAIGWLLTIVCDSSAHAEEAASDVQSLKNQVELLLKRDAEKDIKLAEMEKKLETISAQAAVSRPIMSSTAALDRALNEINVSKPEKPADRLAFKAGAGTLRLIDISFDILWAAGGSTETDESLSNLQGGDHDPRKRGFTYPNTELSLTGAVDQYFTAEAHLVQFLDPLSAETVVELEEGFLTTTSMPFDLQVKAGQFFTEFGRINPVHPHAWKWLGQPVIASRLFGPDGMRGPGARISYLTPAPWFSEVYATVQNANGETMSSFLANDEFFEERPIGGRSLVKRDVKGLKELAYTFRSDNSVDISKEVTTKFGFSASFGPNATGPHGRTRIYGTDLLLKWMPEKNDRGRPYLRWETEFMYRDYVAGANTFDGGTPDDPSDDALAQRDTLHDWGFYTQALYGFRNKWDAGLRFEYASGSGRSAGMFDGRSEDPFRDNRMRISPLAIWNLSEFSRIRFQYNYDRADHLQHDDAHSYWVGFEILIGAHPAHKY
jgi:hypothetical protein